MTDSATIADDVYEEQKESKEKYLDIPKPKETVIKIYNPREHPFGPLSNNAVFPVNIGGKLWNTVTNYVYANMLITPIYRLQMQFAQIKGSVKNTKIDEKVEELVANIEAKQKRRLLREEVEKIKQTVLQEIAVKRMDIYQFFDFKLAQEEYHVIRTAVEKAYNAKVKENPALLDTLLKTENLPIVYVSNNPILGNGENNSGQNVIGVTLMQIRNNIVTTRRREKADEEKMAKNKNIFLAYKAYGILENEIREGTHLQSYAGKSADQIIEEYLKTHPEETLKSLGIDPIQEGEKNNILELYYRDQDRARYSSDKFSYLNRINLITKELERPGYMSLAMLQMGLLYLRIKAEQQRMDIITRLYTEYVVRKQFPKMPADQVTKAALQLYKTIPVDYSKIKHVRQKDDDGVISYTTETDKVHRTIDDVNQIYNKMQDRILDLYNQGLFPEELSEEIKTALESVYFPTDEEIEEAEQMQMSIPEASEKQSSDSTDDGQTKNALKKEIKKLLSDDDKAKKMVLIEQIQKFTGESERKYKNWDLPKLQEHLAKFTGTNDNKPTIKPAENAGHWVIKVKHTNNKKEILKNTSDKPTEENIEKLVAAYNKKGSKKIKRTQVFVEWVSTVRLNRNEQKEVEVVVDEYVKPSGDVVEIRAAVDQNPEDLKEFSPLFEKNFIVDDMLYPSVSLYITTMLLTQTGKSVNVQDKSVIKRGTSISDAYSLVAERVVTLDVKGGKRTTFNFISPDEANKVYQARKVQTFNELLKTFAIVAMQKKFEDKNMQNLLLMTGDRTLVWNDPHDVVLGTGTKERHGKNLGGKILESLRSHIRSSVTIGSKVSYNIDDGRYVSEKALVPKTTNQIYSKRTLLGEDVIDIEKITDFITKDSFMVSWVKMRLADMCEVVYMIKQYLFLVGNQEENIDSKFIEQVLDKVYQPCSVIGVIAKDLNIPIPEEFMVQVMQCQGMPSKLTRDFEAETKKIRDEIQDVEDSFWGIASSKQNEVKNELTIKEFVEYQKRQLEKFLQTKNLENLSQEIQESEEYKRFEQMQAKQFEAFRKKFEKEENKQENFEQKQKEDFQAFVREINKPMLEEEEITRRMAALYERHLKQRTGKENDEEYEKLLEKQQKERKELWTLLIQPEKSLEQRNKKLAEFVDKQEKERLEHYGVKTDTKSPEDKAIHANIIKELKGRLTQVNGKHKSELDHLRFTVLDIAKVYWNRIIAMIFFLAYHTKDPSEQKLRQSIIGAEMLISDKQTCENFKSNNLSDDMDNCIASALANILVGIELFKFQYAKHIVFGKKDIDLAGSIILGRNITEEKIEELPEKVDDEDLDDRFVFEDDMAQESVSEEPFEDYADGDDNSAAEFSMNSRKKAPKSETEQVRIILKEIKNIAISSRVTFIYSQKQEQSQNISNIDEMAEYFIAMIAKIKIYKLPEKIKQNRINFFATLR